MYWNINWYPLCFGNDTNMYWNINWYPLCFGNDTNMYWNINWYPKCFVLIPSVDYFLQMEIWLHLLWLCSLHPLKTSSPAEQHWCVWLVNCLRDPRGWQMSAGCLAVNQWQKMFLPALLSSNQTTPSGSAAIWPFRLQTGTRTWCSHVKCRWGQHSLRKRSERLVAVCKSIVSDNQYNW